MGRDNELVEFKTYCPKALAGIGSRRLPDTIRDRSIEIRMRRIAPGETVERATGARARRLERDATEIRDDWATWAAEATELLRAIEPDDVAELTPRQFEGWEPLLAIAEFAGGDWPQWAREAALKLSGGSEDAVMDPLLEALRRIFDERLPRQKVASEEIVRALNGDEALSFSGWNHGDGIRALDVAKRLKPYGVRPTTVRIDDQKTLKGYSRGDLEDVWRRYLQRTPNPSHSVKPSHENPDKAGDVTAVTAVTAPPDQPGEAPASVRSAPVDIRQFIRNDRSETAA